MAKKSRKPNPGVTAEQLGDAPFDFGHYDIVGRTLDFVPFAGMGKLRLAQIREERWPEIEAAIGVQLDEHQRPWLNLICSFFVFSCVLKNALPAPQRYLADLEKRAKDISSTLYELIGMLSFSDDEASGNAPSPHRVVTTADDHFKLLGFSDWSGPVTALKSFLGEVEAYQDKIKSSKTKTRGRDGHYELHPLLRNLIYLAQSTGDELRITSSDYRADTGPDVNKRTPLVLFVEVVLRVIRLDLDEWVEKYDLTRDQADATRKLVNKLLNKRPGNLLKPLRELVIEIEGKRRSKNKRSNSTN